MRLAGLAIAAALALGAASPAAAAPSNGEVMTAESIDRAVAIKPKELIGVAIAVASTTVQNGVQKRHAVGDDLAALAVLVQVGRAAELPLHAWDVGPARGLPPSPFPHEEPETIEDFALRFVHDAADTSPEARDVVRQAIELAYATPLPSEANPANRAAAAKAWQYAELGLLPYLFQAMGDLGIHRPTQAMSKELRGDFARMRKIILSMVRILASRTSGAFDLASSFMLRNNAATADEQQLTLTFLAGPEVLSLQEGEETTEIDLLRRLQADLDQLSRELLQRHLFPADAPPPAALLTLAHLADLLLAGSTLKTVPPGSLAALNEMTTDSPWHDWPLRNIAAAAGEVDRLRHDFLDWTRDPAAFAVITALAERLAPLLLHPRDQKEEERTALILAAKRVLEIPEEHERELKNHGKEIADLRVTRLARDYLERLHARQPLMPEERELHRLVEYRAERFKR
jgi:hypothetical protein